MMPGAQISDKVAICYQAFQRLLEGLRQATDLTSGTEDGVQRQFDRFKMWVGNIGAHRKGQSSLDFRLRDASHISQAVLSMLDRLHDLMAEAHDVLSNGAEALDDDDESDLELDLEGFEPMPVSETMDNVLSFISDTVKALLRISMAIKNPAPQDRYMAAKTIDTTFYESFDIQHVRSLYHEKSTSPFLIERLGRANTSRRQFLKYSQAHRERLAAGQPDVPHADSKSTVATSLQSDLKAPQAKLKYENAGYAASIVSGTTINTTAPGRDHMRVVPFPAEAIYNEEFECPLCRCIISIRDWNHWKSHQFRDLQPYICIYENCLIGSRIYGSRKDWQAHLEQHMQATGGFNEPLHCPICKQACRRGDFVDHVAREMQRLALFVIPSELFDDAEGVDEGESAEGESDESSRVEPEEQADLQTTEDEVLQARKADTKARLQDAAAIGIAAMARMKDESMFKNVDEVLDNDQVKDDSSDANQRLKALEEQTQLAQREQTELQQALLATADEMIAARDGGQPKTVAKAKLSILRERLAQGVTGNQLAQLRQRIEHSASQHGYLNDAKIDPAALERWQKELEEALEADTESTFAEVNQAVADVPVAQSARQPFYESDSEASENPQNIGAQIEQVPILQELDNSNRQFVWLPKDNSDAYSQRSDSVGSATSFGYHPARYGPLAGPPSGEIPIARKMKPVSSPPTQSVKERPLSYDPRPYGPSSNTQPSAASNRNRTSDNEQAAGYEEALGLSWGSIPRHDEDHDHAAAKTSASHNDDHPREKFVKSETPSSAPSGRRSSPSQHIGHIQGTPLQVLDAYIANYHVRVQNALDEDQLSIAEGDLQMLIKFAEVRKAQFNVDFDETKMQKQLAEIHRRQGRQIQVFGMDDDEPARHAEARRVSGSASDMDEAAIFGDDQRGTTSDEVSPSEKAEAVRVIAEEKRAAQLAQAELSQRMHKLTRDEESESAIRQRPSDTSPRTLIDSSMPKRSFDIIEIDRKPKASREGQARNRVIGSWTMGETAAKMGFGSSARAERTADEESFSLDHEAGRNAEHRSQEGSIQKPRDLDRRLEKDLQDEIAAHEAEADEQAASAQKHDHYTVPSHRVYSRGRRDVPPHVRVRDATPDPFVSDRFGRGENALKEEEHGGKSIEELKSEIQRLQRQLDEMDAKGSPPRRTKKSNNSSKVDRFYAGNLEGATPPSALNTSGLFSDDRSFPEQWTCGECGHGPMVIAVYPMCVDCGHVFNVKTCGMEDNCLFL